MTPVVAIFAAVFAKRLDAALGLTTKPHVPPKPISKAGWSRVQGPELERRTDPEDGTRSPVTRYGEVGMMRVEVLWIGDTVNNGRRAKVRDLKTKQVKWVNADRVRLTNTPWKVGNL